MRKLLAIATLLAGPLSGAALAAEPQPQPAGPLVLGDEQLDRVAAGYLGGCLCLPYQAFYQAHDTLAANSGGLPGPAQTAIGLVHTAIFVISY